MVPIAYVKRDMMKNIKNMIGIVLDCQINDYLII